MVFDPTWKPCWFPILERSPVSQVSLHCRYPSPLLRSAVLFGEKRGCRQVLDAERAEVSREIWREGSKGLTKSKATMMVPAWMDGDLVVNSIPWYQKKWTTWWNFKSKFANCLVKDSTKTSTMFCILAKNPGKNPSNIGLPSTSNRRALEISACIPKNL